MQQYPVKGSEALAPIPVEAPSHLPEEPKKKRAAVEAPKQGVSPFTVAAIAVVLLLFFGLLFSMMRLFEVRSENGELQRQKQELQTLQDQLTAQYENAIDMDEIAQRAEALGMHLPWAEQIEYVHIELPEPVERTTQEIESGMFAAFQAMVQDMQAYFS